MVLCHLCNNRGTPARNGKANVEKGGLTRKEFFFRRDLFLPVMPLETMTSLDDVALTTCIGMYITELQASISIQRASARSKRMSRRV